MTRIGILLAGSFGLAAIVRAALFYAGVDTLALSIVVIMAVGLVVGMVELLGRVRQFDALRDELGGLPTPATDDTIAKASAVLRPFLRARIDNLSGTTSMRGGPLFASYVVGLLVMLGLLGTFLGLFETLRGAREALTSSSDVDALRAGLARPMQGLTRSFGTSAAGVAASAGLGLATVLARRAEASFVRALQAYAVGALATLTTPHRTLVALEALVRQGEALPRAAGNLESAARKLEDLEQSWRVAHKDATLETSHMLKSAADAIGADLQTSVGRVATATHDAVAPILRKALTETTTAASAHLVALRAVAESDASARRTRDEAHAQALEKAQEAASSAIAASHAHAESAREKSEALHLRLESLVKSVDAAAKKTTDSVDEHAARLARFELEVSRTHAEAASQVSRAVTEHAGEQASMLAEHAARLSQFETAMSKTHADAAALVTKTVTEHAGDLADKLVEHAARLSQFETEMSKTHADAASLVTKTVTEHAGEVADKLMEHAARLSQFETEMSKTHADAASQAAETMTEHADGLAETLATAARLVSESTELLRAGGGELGAVAEAFSAAVDRHRDASTVWLESLGTIEGAVENAGERAAAGALGDTLARMHEAFDRQVQVQLELFAQLRALRERDIPLALVGESDLPVPPASPSAGKIERQRASDAAV